MKRLSFLLMCVLLAMAVHAQRAKYVFFFIGDGMGLNQVNTTEMYLGEQDGRIGIAPALATGSKTYNGAIGVNTDKETLTSVAEQAKRSGKKVGVTTSVSVDHATPASFYAHQPDRNMYYEIAQDMLKAGFDFYAGGGFLKPATTFDGKDAPSIFPQIEEAGYTLARGVDEYEAKCADAEKMVLIQKEGTDPSCLPYAIDRREGDLTLKQITESAIDFLTKDTATITTPARWCAKCWTWMRLSRWPTNSIRSIPRKRSSSSRPTTRRVVWAWATKAIRWP